jgi:hypothetical protein
MCSIRVCIAIAILMGYRAEDNAAHINIIIVNDNVRAHFLAWFRESFPEFKVSLIIIISASPL